LKTIKYILKLDGFSDRCSNLLPSPYAIKKIVIEVMLNTVQDLIIKHVVCLLTLGFLNGLRIWSWR